MYERESVSGHTVEWNPRNESVAIQAMKDVDGTGVPSKHTIPNDANVVVENAVAQRVKERYQKLCMRSLSVSFKDGEVAGGGTDTETVTVELRDGDGNLVSGTNTAVLDVDGYKYAVELTDGRGTHDITTSKDAGSNLAVQAIEVTSVDTSNDMSVEPSQERAVNVT